MWLIGAVHYDWLGLKSYPPAPRLFSDSWPVKESAHVQGVVKSQYECNRSFASNISNQIQRINTSSVRTAGPIARRMNSAFLASNNAERLHAGAGRSELRDLAKVGDSLLRHT